MKQAIAFIKEELPSGARVLDLGGHAEEGSLKSTCKERKISYHCLDLRPTGGPTLVGDAHRVPVRNNEIDLVVANSLLEHLQDPNRCCQEIHRILRPGGMLIGYVPFIFPYHAGAEEEYRDYYRFTEDGLRYLFRRFEEVDIVPSSEGYFGAGLRFFTGFSGFVRYWKFIPILMNNLIFSTLRGIGSLFGRSGQGLRNLERTTTGFYFMVSK